MQERKHKLESLLHDLNKINDFNFSHKKINEIGYVMKCYYEIHINITDFLR